MSKASIPHMAEAAVSHCHAACQIASVSQAVHHLRGVCPRMRKLIGRVGPCGLTPERKREPFEALVRAIAHQQLHGKAAATITARFIALYPGMDFPTPAMVLGTEQATLRGCGFSGNKVAAILDIATHAQAGLVPTRKTATRLSDATLIERLTAIRGVGQWTVEMLLMFTLGRPDIMPIDDFGVREGYRLLYGLETQPKPKQLAELGLLYAPYRSAASWYLWRAADEGKTLKPAVKI